MANSAQRLHDLLQKSKEQQLASLDMMSAWRKLLSLPENFGDLATMARVGKVFTLPALVANQIQRFPDLEPELFLGWRPELEQALFAISFGNSFHGFAGRLSPSLLINIRFCARELEQRIPERTVDPNEIAKLRELAWSLCQELLQASLSAPLQQYLLDLLYLMLEALDDYNIIGVVGMEHAVDAVLGSFFTKPAMAEEVKSSGFGPKFWNVVSRMGTALKFAKSAIELMDKAKGLLPEQ